MQNYQIHNILPHISKRSINNVVLSLRHALSKEEKKRRDTLIIENEVECGKVTELDESMFGKKTKNNRGKKYTKSWVFGMVDRGRRNVVLQIVAKRDTQTLLPLILKHIPKSTKVYHDDWAVYRNLHRHGYEHKVVVHTKQFKAKDGTHTNTIEGIWGVLKQRINRMHGIRHENLYLVLDEYCYRFYHKGHMLEAVLKALTG